MAKWKSAHDLLGDDAERFAHSAEWLLLLEKDPEHPDHPDSCWKCHNLGHKGGCSVCGKVRARRRVAPTVRSER